MRGNFVTDRTGERNPNYKHGKKGTRLYRIYYNMVNRCTNTRHTYYSGYGGRGIKVCDEWDNFQAFYDWSMSHGYSEELTLDRIDNDGNYSPDNCRWATVKEQANNRSRCIFITINNDTKTLKEWCEITGINYSTAHDRIRHGWDPAKAVTTPSNPKFRRKVIAC